MYLALNHLAINILQNLLFCVPKAAVLHCKSVGFALQNSRFRNAKTQLPLFKEIIFTRSEVFLHISLKVRRKHRGKRNYRETCRSFGAMNVINCSSTRQRTLQKPIGDEEKTKEKADFTASLNPIQKHYEIILFREQDFHY
ncbi:hypothetical protein [Prevotella falsenii]|uniref:hypothetical protein n=1 Tax=Prevotella falsenii TaxID=515414 RepID=UPI000566A68A|nr:hypothetical protein [Prevotella falsenii]